MLAAGVLIAGCRHAEPDISCQELILASASGDGPAIEAWRKSRTPEQFITVPQLTVREGTADRECTADRVSSCKSFSGMRIRSHGVFDTSVAGCSGS